MAINCNDLVMGLIPSCNYEELIASKLKPIERQRNCNNCGANEFKNHKCKYCGTQYAIPPSNQIFK